MISIPSLSYLLNFCCTVCERFLTSNSRKVSFLLQMCNIPNTLLHVSPHQRRDLNSSVESLYKAPNLLDGNPLGISVQVPYRGKVAR